jgi:phosphoglucosamine mutase
MLETALCSGIMSVGGHVISVGILPTPAVAVLTRYYGATSGVVISASHNPYYDNGIKFFNASGLKLADEIEEEIEQAMDIAVNHTQFTHEKIGTLKAVRNAADLYIAFLLDAIPPMDLQGLKIALDCSTGATYIAAPEIFTKLGAEIKVIAGKPNGTNINDNCGSTHIASLQNEVVTKHADFGLAFDGDGDRLIAVDENGKEVNGDGIMYLCARFLQKEKRLQKDTLVLTKMSNIGLKIALQREGIDIVETNVGDRYILQKMLDGGYNLGGEQSGHIIFSDVNTTGDGLATALLLTSIIKKSGKTLSQNVANFITYPQVLVNVRVHPDKKLIYAQNEQILTRIQELQKKYDGEAESLSVIRYRAVDSDYD